MSRSSTRWSGLRALAICVQFLPWPNRPWQKATVGPPEGPAPLAESVEPAPEEHAHEHPVHRAEAAEVALGVGLVGPSTLPVGHAARSDHHLADVGLCARAH